MIEPFNALKVKVIPLTYFWHPSMRYEIYIENPSVDIEYERTAIVGSQYVTSQSGEWGGANHNNPSYSNTIGNLAWIA